MIVPDDRTQANARLTAMQIGLSVLFFLLVVSFWAIQVLQHDRYLEEAESNRRKFDSLDPWKACGDCAYMPTCAGGCLTASYSQLGDVNTPTCHKPTFESAVIALAHRVSAQQETVQ